MLDKERIDEIRQANQAWASRQSKASGEPAPNPRGADGIPLRPHGLYTPADLTDIGFDYLRDAGLPVDEPTTSFDPSHCVL